MTEITPAMILSAMSKTDFSKNEALDKLDAMIHCYFHPECHFLEDEKDWTVVSTKKPYVRIEQYTRDEIKLKGVVDAARKHQRKEKLRRFIKRILDFF